MNKNPRVSLMDTMQEVLYKMSEGNPGGLTVMINLLKSDAVEGFMYLLDLDDMGIYGSKIWLAYKDVCREDLEVLKTKIQDRSIKDDLAKQ